MTNKLYYLLLLVCLTIAVLNSTSVLATNTTQVSVNGNIIDFDAAPIKKSEENLLVPLRKISEEIGAAAAWNHTEKQVTLLKDRVIVTLTIGEEYAVVNG
ncbi:stalk domain-containing protein [Bacillus taeanensis]|uniref:stalk domain-containing protein n=1 Tax=Bacillus taeanensis TaxID=273032 RepID=UPI0015F09B62|nr:stalk domain-containing protein [Bacillus taeanensis]